MRQNEIIQKSFIRPDGIRCFTERQFDRRKKLNLIPIKITGSRTTFLSEAEYCKRFPNHGHGT
jgi:hypothetical protein